MNTLKNVLVFALLFLLIVGKSRAQTPKPPPTTFRDGTAEMGLAISADAACCVDIDNDGWTDLIVGGVVWRNNQGKGFTKIAEGFGSVVAADFDNDGFVDIFSCSQMKLYHNNGGKSFTEVPLPKLPPTVSRGACWGDFNNDGFVDLYIGGYEDWDRDITYPSFILMNDAGKGFHLAWTSSAYRTRGVTACDFNRSGRLSVYVSNYRLQPNQLIMSDAAGKFIDRAAEFNVVATSPGFDGGHSIGACWGDFDSDGEFDLFAGNFAHVDSRGDQPKSRFLRNVGPHEDYQFADLGTCGVFYQESYASPAAGDYDNDGYLDLFFTTVYGVASFSKPNFPVLYRNEGMFRFVDVTALSNVANLPPTYQAAWADFKHDGHLDLVAGGKLFINQCSNGYHWLELRLQGDGTHVNRSAIGAQVRIKLKDKIITRQVEAGTGEGNQNDLTLHFGLGAARGHIDIEIVWPDGKKQTLRHVQTDKFITIARKQ